MVISLPGPLSVPVLTREVSHDDHAVACCLAVIEPEFSEAEKLALAGFLAGYSGMTREAYTLDLRQFTAWCRQRQLRLFAVRRADIELFARDLEAAARARAAVTRRLSAIAGLYTYAVEEDLLDHSPAAHVRRPRIDYESRAAGLDRNEVGALLVAAGLGTAAEHAPISLLALNGLRVSEATGADVEALGTGTLAITGKGGKKAVIPLAPRTARAVDLAIGDRCEGPIFRGRLTDWVSLGVLAAFVPRDAVDDAVAAAGRQARRSDGKGHGRDHPRKSTSTRSAGTGPTPGWSNVPATTPTGSNGPATTAPATTGPPRSSWSTSARTHSQPDQPRLRGIAAGPGARPHGLVTRKTAGSRRRRTS